MSKYEPKLSRRQFTTGAASLVAASALSPSLQAQGWGDKLRVGIIGCGSRCTIDARDLLIAGGDVEIVAIADMFQDKVDAFLKTLKNPEKYWGKYDQAQGKLKVSRNDVYLGFDAADELIARKDVDLIILATPPAFRPIHAEKAVRAGKHLFMEKPGAVDVNGIRKLMAVHEEADRRGLSIAIGTQARRMPHYIETIRRINEGAIGKVTTGLAYWHGGMVDWHWEPQTPGMSDMEHQIRAWPHFLWIGGDHYVEQHLHNLDVMNWVLGTPKQCLGRGGQAQRKDKGPIFDHFAVEFEYENGVRVISGASQMKGCSDIVGERFLGPDGEAWLSRGGCYIKGKNPWKWEGDLSSGGQEQFADLTRAIRTNKPINECRRLAEATLMTIMGRMSAYSGRALSWKWALKSSKEDLALSPTLLRLDATLPKREVPIPGVTRLV